MSNNKILYIIVVIFTELSPQTKTPTFVGLFVVERVNLF